MTDSRYKTSKIKNLRYSKFNELSINPIKKIFNLYMLKVKGSKKFDAL
jgi:hypothetical protein